MPVLEHLDINVLPLNTPVLMMTAEGYLLKDTSKPIIPFVELEQVEEGTLVIRSCDSCKYLKGKECYFCDYNNFAFETKRTPNGLVVFETPWNSHCLGMTSDGRKGYIECKNAYDGTSQQWLLLKPVNVSPLTCYLQYLARVPLQNPTARRELIVYFSGAGKTSKEIVNILELLYGSSAPFVHDACIEPSEKERHEQILKLMRMKKHSTEVCSIMTLLYGKNDLRAIADVNLLKTTKQRNFGILYRMYARFLARVRTNQDTCKAEYDDENYTVGNADLNKIPLNTPLVMVSSVGTTLNMPEKSPCFVKLNARDDGLVMIQSADDNEKCLILNPNQQACFGEAELALNFRIKVSSTGQIVFVEDSTGCVLETEIQGLTKLVVCRNKYSRDAQSWLLCTAYQLDSYKPKVGTSLLSNTVAVGVAAERRHFIIRLAASQTPSKALQVVRKILKNLYGTTAPLQKITVTDAICLERQQQILKLLRVGISTADIRKILTMMYGTSTPLSAK